MKYEIRQVSIPSQSILHFIYAKCLVEYLSKYNYKIYNRTNIDSSSTSDFLTWSRNKFDDEINIAYSKTIENETILKKTPLLQYEQIFDFLNLENIKNQSVYNYFIQENIAYYKSKLYNCEKDIRIVKSFSNLILGSSDDFLKFDVTLCEDNNLKKLLRFLQILEKSQPDLATQFDRLVIVETYFFNDKEMLLKILNNFQKKVTEDYLLQKILSKKASLYTILVDQNNLYNQKAVQVLDSVIAIPIRSNAYKNALLSKHEITRKHLSFQYTKHLYPNENSRMYLTYKNIKKITLKIYKINFKTKEHIEMITAQKDSVVNSIIDSTKSIKEISYILDDKKDYLDHTTEILLPQLSEVGTYLLYFENDTPSKTDKAYGFQTITVTNFTLLTNQKNNEEYYYVLDRKTGKPITNVSLSNKRFQIKTDTNGLAKTSKKTPEDYPGKKILFIKEMDTLSMSNYYLNDFNNTREREDNRSKITFFLDRGIYRPGQTVYFKGIAIQKKGNTSTVVPNLTVVVNLEDVNDQVIKKIQLISNEFGSFSGEFILPKNGLTGNFTIKADEPEDLKVGVKSDSFWDNLEYQDDLSFKVEEYKRPTFKVAFNSFKEIALVNKPVSIFGNANAFNGSAISDAKISYSITRETYYKSNNYSKNDPESIATGNTTTNKNGTFKIDFIALPSEEKNKNLPLFKYIINATITDTNGETQSAETILNAGYHDMILTMICPKTVESKIETTIPINTTTLNGEFFSSKLDVKVYLVSTHGGKFKERKFSVPELSTIAEEDFDRLFPYEKNSKNYYNYEKEKLVYTNNITTSKDQLFSLDFMKNYQSGNYRIVFSMTDSQNNLIENTSAFEFLQSNNPFDTNQIITLTQLNKNPKVDGFVTLKIVSIVPDLYLLMTGCRLNEVFTEQSINVKNNEAIITIPIDKSSNNSLTFGFQGIFDNQSFTKGITIKHEVKVPKLEFETISFRNKIEPGCIENWSFKLKSDDLLSESEVLASMYDSSLDSFIILDWRKLEIYNYDYQNFCYRNSVGFENNYFQLNYLNRHFSRFELNNETTKLLWFGFNFINSTDPKLQKEYRKQITKKSKKPLDAKMIYGIVSDLSGGLPGANVIVKGTNRVAQTDVDGFYELEAAKGETIQITFTGYHDSSLVIGKLDRYDVHLIEASIGIQEVLVTGALGIQEKKEAVTYASQVLKTKEITQAGNPNIVEQLTGSVAGLQINENSDGLTITIRGNKSQTGNDLALLVVDNIIVSSDDVSKIAPDSILDVRVLKGSEGTLLYGIAGANGVLIITTKKVFQDLGQVKTRKNLSETAFFFPELKTEKGGKINFSFTSPEALTQWKLRLMAHNKNAISGYLEKTIVTQKDLMVIPNFPRFFRENDTIVITSKISNMTSIIKSGVVQLQFFDAITMKSIDEKISNINNVKSFLIESLGSTSVSWKIIIPIGLQGIHYKIVAKCGDYSDGEENIIPVLTNNILVTETIPIWVRENSKKEFTLENLKYNTSSTLRSHQLTLEYTSNPTWLAIQSLPYLMEYEHECAEQTFSRYYASVLATEIINSNPKIATLFESWKKTGKLNSKLEQNEELKSILLAETPWMMDAQNEEEKKMKLALLFDLEKMKEFQEIVFTKFQQKQKPSGGFGWFEGGNENEYITRHILAGLGHLEKIAPNSINLEKINSITSKGVHFIDTKFIEQDELKLKIALEKNLVSPVLYSDLHYLYTRSFYLTKYPLKDNFKQAILKYLASIKENWLDYTLYEKVLASMTLHRYGETKFAKVILENLKQSASNQEDWGMYWIENSSNWHWDKSPIETQALLIEAFSEINNDEKSVDAMKVWLLKNKQTKNWSTTKATTEAVYALLLKGTDWLSVKDKTTIKIGTEKISTKKLSENEKEAETGYLKFTWKAEEITKEMASIIIENKSNVPSYGGLYWQYFEDLDKIKMNSVDVLSVSKELYHKKNGNTLQKITPEKPLKIGDLITVRLLIIAKENMEFVHLKDMRASCFEPISVLSEYQWSDGLGFYKSSKDTATHLFFDKINQGTYVIEYDIRVNNSGHFSNGITTIQSMYAPEFASHSKGIRVFIEK